MVRNRVRLARMIALILALAMLPEHVGAQAMNCEMRGTHVNQGQHGIIEHYDRGHDAGSPSTPGRGSHSSGMIACSQSMICANVAVVPTKTTQAFHLDDGTSQISFDRHVLEARTVRPEPPPPRI